MTAVRLTKTRFRAATKGGFYPLMKNHQLGWWIFIIIKTDYYKRFGFILWVSPAVS